LRPSFIDSPCAFPAQLHWQSHAPLLTCILRAESPQCDSPGWSAPRAAPGQMTSSKLLGPVRPPLTSTHDKNPKRATVFPASRSPPTDFKNANGVPSQSPGLADGTTAYPGFPAQIPQKTLQGVRLFRPQIRATEARPSWLTPLPWCKKIQADCCRANKENRRQNDGGKMIRRLQKRARKKMQNTTKYPSYAKDCTPPSAASSGLKARNVIARGGAPSAQPRVKSRHQNSSGL